MKWKNYGLWVSIASVLYMVINDLGYQIDLTRWDTYVTALLGILVALGVISNPESGKGFFNAKTPTEHVPTNKNNPTNNSNYGNNETSQNEEITNLDNPQDYSEHIDNSSDNQISEEITPYRRYPPDER
ncbi:MULTISPECIES: hypothetical protein [Metabacillus]|uniref:Holin n=2 Tax=Metabacillus TaxID=2675233 RepID=A0ABX6S6G8_9BACI|nr:MULTISPECIES: hypothetical protein [Metabacillus]QNF29622.1 hypothetical protein HUW50_20280 [Metabacillus sp. KUDC1714]